MRFALVDSGLGVLPTAAQLLRADPTVELVLSIDPDGMPWGARTPDDITARAMGCARAALRHHPDVLVLACNTASVRSLDALRAELEPAIPVVGTVPAIKPAAAAGEPIAVWATAATTGSAYQRELINRFAAGVPVTEVACPGLADRIDAGDDPGIDQMIAAAAERTPPETCAIVLGCTQYELAAERIRVAVPQARVLGSAAAVASEALRRISARAAAASADLAMGQDAPPLRVLLSGRSGELPASAHSYPEGRLLIGGRSRA
jgi:glutamate racemase